MADSNAAAERAEREERLASDLEEVEAKLNNCRENVETLMLQVKKIRDLEKSVLGRKSQLLTLVLLQFIAKEGDVGNLMLRYFEQKRDYHAQMADRISQHVQQFQKSLNKGLGPTFGCDLRVNLSTTKNTLSTKKLWTFCLSGTPGPKRFSDPIENRLSAAPLRSAAPPT